MADVKITALSSGTPSADDLLIYVDNPGGSPVTKKTTVGEALGIAGWWVDSSAYASINAAVAAIGGTSTTLVVSTSETLTASITFPATLTLKIVKGGMIVKAAAYTVTINGPFEAGPYQVFSGFTVTNITFGAGVATIVLPQWWGDAGTGFGKIEESSVLDIRQITVDERMRLYKAMTASADFGNDNHGWVLRTEAEYDYASWTLGAGYVPGCHILTLTNKLNDTGIEMPMIYGYIYNLTANSKAAVYGYGVDIIKQSPCVTANTLFGYSALICSSVDPNTALKGSGFRATSRDLSPYTGVRQYAAFVSHGDRGWKYPFLAYDTDDTTALFIVDQYGNGYFMGELTINGMPTYSNNGAALAGGLVAGNLYHTGADPDVVCIVH